MLNYEEFKRRWDKEHSLKCPHCGTDYTRDYEFTSDLITYHGEEGPIEKECLDCGKKFFVEEVVDRTFIVGKELMPNDKHHIKEED